MAKPIKIRVTVITELVEDATDINRVMTRVETTRERQQSMYGQHYVEEYFGRDHDRLINQVATANMRQVMAYFDEAQMAPA